MVSEKAGVTGAAPPDAAKSFAINFNTPSRFGGAFSLYALTHADKVSWIDAIEKQQAYLIESKRKFELTTLNDGFFVRSNAINCACYYKHHLIIGTDAGLYVGIYSEVSSVSSPSGEVKLSFVKVLELEKIYQVDVITKIDNLLVLAGMNYPCFLQVIC